MLVFEYTDSKGRKTTRTLKSWVERGNYLQGFCLLSDGIRTFSKERIENAQERGAPGDKESDSRPRYFKYEKARVVVKDTRAEIVFTGFAKEARAELEAAAENAGLKVVKSSTKKLSYLVGGENAGPAKIVKAHEAGAFILSADEFYSLIATGELPD